MSTLKLEKPEEKILSGICDEFNLPYCFNGKFDDKDNIILTPYDLKMNDSNTFYFHIKPKNWSGDSLHLVSWTVDLTKTGKVKKRSLRKTPVYN